LILRLIHHARLRKARSRLIPHWTRLGVSGVARLRHDGLAHCPVSSTCTHRRFPATSLDTLTQYQSAQNSPGEQPLAGGFILQDRGRNPGQAHQSIHPHHTSFINWHNAIPQNAVCRARALSTGEWHWLPYPELRCALTLPVHRALSAHCAR